MKWTRLELAILAAFEKLPNNSRSTTSRERHFALMGIRLSLIGIVLMLSIVPVEWVADWTASLVLGIAGIVLFALGNALLIIAMIVVAIGGMSLGR